jgi:hypothetical protein
MGGIIFQHQQGNENTFFLAIPLDKWLQQFYAEYLVIEDGLGSQLLAFHTLKIILATGTRSNHLGVTKKHDRVSVEAIKQELAAKMFPAWLVFL